MSIHSMGRCLNTLYIVGKKNATPANSSDINSDSTLLDNHHSWIDEIKEVLECYS